MSEGITGLPCSWEIETRESGPPSWGSLKFETVKYYESSGDSDPRKTALARLSNNFKLHARPLVREGAPHQQTLNCLKMIK
jgi:hypothetical protein